MNLLFVCTGNTCRSPMAASLAQKRFAQRSETQTWQVESAGIQAVQGHPVNPAAFTVLSERYSLCPIVDTAAQVSREQLRWADQILTMTEAQAIWLETVYPEFQEKISSLIHAATGVLGDVADPYGSPVEVYEKTAEELNELIDQWVRKQL